MRFQSLILALALMGTVSAHAGVIGQVGTTYPILEKDAITEIEEAAKRVDWESVFKKAADKAALTYGMPEEGVKIPNAKENRDRILDMTTILPFDIPDPANLRQVLYPAGMKINPLAAGEIPGDFVFLNGEDKAQLDWFKKKFPEIGNEIVIITNGKVPEVEKILGRQLFAASKAMINRLGVEYVPCIAQQKGDKMVMEEFYVNKD